MQRAWIHAPAVLATRQLELFKCRSPHCSQVRKSLVWGTEMRQSMASTGTGGVWCAGLRGRNKSVFTFVCTCLGEMVVGMVKMGPGVSNRYCIVF